MVTDFTITSSQLALAVEREPPGKEGPDELIVWRERGDFYFFTLLGGSEKGGDLGLGKLGEGRCPKLKQRISHSVSCLLFPSYTNHRA